MICIEMMHHHVKFNSYFLCFGDFFAKHIIELDNSTIKLSTYKSYSKNLVQEIGIPLMSNSNNSPLPERKSSKRYPGTLTSSTLCEELDYVDIDSMHDSQTSRLNGGDSDGQVVRGERSPIPYSEETTSSATDVNPTSPIQTISAPIIPSIKQESKQIGALIIQNQSAADIEHTSNGDSKISRSNGKTSSRDEVRINKNSENISFT
jgi:hypothetical protein